MSTKVSPDYIEENRWHYAQSIHELRENTISMLRIEGRQIALLHSPIYLDMKQIGYYTGFINNKARLQ